MGKSDTKTLVNRYMSAYGISEFVSQSIFPIVVGVGLVKNVGRVTHLKLEKGKPHKEKLESLGCDTESKLHAMLKAAAAIFNVMLSTAENALGEITRKRMQKDLFFRGQTLYDVIKDGTKWTLVQKVPVSKVWTKCPDLHFNER